MEPFERAGVKIRLIQSAFTSCGGRQHGDRRSGRAFSHNARDGGQQLVLKVIHVRGFEIGIGNSVRRRHSRKVVLLVVLSDLGNAVVVASSKRALLGRVHQNFSARDVAEGEKRIDRHILRSQANNAL